MTTPMAISKCLRFSKSLPLRSLIQFHLNPISAAADSIGAASESQSRLRVFETKTPNSPLRNDVAAVIRNQVNMAALLTRGRAVKIDDEFNEEDFEDESDEFEDEDEEEFDEMDGEDCVDDDDDEDEDPVYKKRK